MLTFPVLFRASALGNQSDHMSSLLTIRYTRFCQCFTFHIYSHLKSEIFILWEHFYILLLFIKQSGDQVLNMWEASLHAGPIEMRKISFLPPRSWESSKKYLCLLVSCHIQWELGWRRHARVYLGAGNGVAWYTSSWRMHLYVFFHDLTLWNPKSKLKETLNFHLMTLKSKILNKEQC